MKYLSVVLVCALYGIGPRVSATSIQTCSTSDDGGSSGGGGAMSTDKFWDGYDGAEFIDDLTNKNFDKWVEDNPNGFVMYINPRCGPCKDSREGFSGAAKEMEDKVRFGGVNCDNAENICRGKAKTKFPKITGTPSFYLFKNGTYSDKYRYERSKERFVAWLTPRVED